MVNNKEDQVMAKKTKEQIARSERAKRAHQIRKMKAMYKEAQVNPTPYPCAQAEGISVNQASPRPADVQDSIDLIWLPPETSLLDRVKKLEEAVDYLWKAVSNITQSVHEEVRRSIERIDKDIEIHERRMRRLEAKIG